MRKNISFLGAALVVAVLVSGCANTEKKLGRGMNNLYEPIRLADMRRSIEQSALYGGQNANYPTGVAHGLGKTLTRFGVGLYEIVTAPFPPYDPVLTNYLSPNPQYPDSFKPGLIEDSVFATDTTMGFSGGDIAPYIPGSRFRIFDAP